jgi:hypothetical protein
VGNLGGFFGPSIIGFVQHKTALIIIGLLIGLGGWMALLVRAPQNSKAG